jgi:Tfp pilus assembly protein FimT
MEEYLLQSPEGCHWPTHETRHAFCPSDVCDLPGTYGSRGAERTLIDESACCAGLQKERPEGSFMMLANPKKHGIGGGSEKGLSIIEVATVALIVVTVMAFALPAVSRAVSAYNLRSAANHLAERISAVRALALAKNKSVTFSFNNGTGLYGFDFNADGVPDTSDPDDTSVSYYTESLPSGITATFPGGTPIQITFDSRGELPIGSATQTIGLSNQKGTATVSVNLRGQVAVH